MMSQKLESIINTAIVKANELKHEYLTLEGTLLALVDDPVVEGVLLDCGCDLNEIKNELVDFLQDQQNFSILSEDQIKELGEKQFVNEELRTLAQENGVFYQPELSLALQRVLQRAALHVQSAGKKQIMGIHLLVSLFGEEESYALYVLEKQGVDRLKVVEKISHSLDKPQTENADEEEQEEEAQGGKKKKKKALDEFASNLNELAAAGKIDPIIGREKEINRMTQILCRRRKNNPMLVGDAGVGKTALAEGLAWSIVQGKVSSALENCVLYSLDMASLLAGAKFRGEFEERLKAVIKEISDLSEKGQMPILFIDEIHTVMGAGATSGGSLDASNLLKPALSSGAVRCMGSTTHEEYRKFIEREPAFGRRFQKLDVQEPTGEETFHILQGLKDRFEEHHGVTYSQNVLKLAVELSEKHISDRHLPDKAIDVIDEAGAYVQLKNPGSGASRVGPKDIEHVVSFLARIPMKSVASNEREKLKNLSRNLKLLIYGQDEAVETISDAILLSRSGLALDDKPTANFLFTGPTGVGKTELAKQLSFNLGIHFERFDMSEYMEKHAVAKLIGAPPGYVGHDQGGLLTDAVKKHPYCVLLLDEIEKAHPDIYNILLQVMDHGALTDSHGRVTDFRNAIIIMTTNAGAKEMDAGSIGLSSTGGIEKNFSKRDQALKNYFTPEFRNRLDAIIHFNGLAEEQIIQVVEKFLGELERKLLEKKIDLQVTTDVKKWLAKNGYDPKMGARPIHRLINDKIKKPLSHKILFDELEKGGKVVLRLRDDEIYFDVDA